MSIYQGASWNTELDVSRLARPDSLFAFHFEPALLLLALLYAVGGGATLLLVIQAIAVAAGALPAYRLGLSAGGSASCGLAVAMAYLLSPLGQWAVLADFHTAAFAAPLLLLAAERLVVNKSAGQAVAAAVLAAATREDVGLAVAGLGLILLVPGHTWLRGTSPSTSARPPIARPPSDELSVTMRRHAGRHADADERHVGVIATSQSRTLAGVALLGLGIGATLLAALVIRLYSGDVSLFDVRYGPTLRGGPAPALAALARPSVLGYLGTLGLSGGWLGLLAPLAVVPALPSLALNILSVSPWMAAGKAHYSILVLPFIVLGAAAGLRSLRSRPVLLHVACGALVLTSAAGYLFEAAGPLGGNYAPAEVTPHALQAEALADSLPEHAAVSASSALVPRISHRQQVYVFPAVLDADYVFLDLHASPAPTSAGDVFMRVRGMLAAGGWNVESADGGLLLLHRAADAPPVDTADLSAVLESRPAAAKVMMGVSNPSGSADAGPAALAGVDPEADSARGESPIGSFWDDRVSLLSATLMPSPDGAVEVNGPSGVLRVVLRAEQPLPSGTHVDFWIDLRDHERLHVWDIAPLWWNPPDRWTPGEAVTIDIPDVPMREFMSWQAVWATQAE